MQECYLCKTKKDLHNFIRRRDGKYYRVCIKCNWEVQKNRGKKRLKHTATHRTCYKCLRVLKNINFTRRSTGTYFSACKECNKYGFAQTRRARLLQSEGSFTSREFREKLKKYEKCPICKKIGTKLKNQKILKLLLQQIILSQLAKVEKIRLIIFNPCVFLAIQEKVIK